MKHLKAYRELRDLSSGTSSNIFESNSINESEIIDYLNDIFIDLNDMNIDVKIKPKYTSHREIYTEPGKVGGTREVAVLSGFDITISTVDLSFRYSNYRDKNTFNLIDVYDMLLMCESYLKSIGFYIYSKDGGSPMFSKIDHYQLDYGMNLHKSDPDKYPLFDHDLVYLKIDVRKSKS